MSKLIVVTGATGHQGGQVIRSLLKHPSFSSDEYSIAAVTRNTASPAAKSLASLSLAVKLSQGDLSSPSALIRSLPTKPWAIFIMTNQGKTEVADGSGLIDAAMEAGVLHIVLTSVDRGYSEKEGYNRPCIVPHWNTKHQIEAHLRNRIAAGDRRSCSYTIVRPVMFLDNFAPNFFGKVTATLWSSFLVEKPLKTIDTADVGNFAAHALLERGAPRFHNAEVNLAGDELTFAQANKIFQHKTKKSIPTTYKWLTNLLLLMAKDFKLMTRFLIDEGYGAPVDNPDVPFSLTRFETWVDRSELAKSMA